jgi:hypothetical protein
LESDPLLHNIIIPKRISTPFSKINSQKAGCSATIYLAIARRVRRITVELVLKASRTTKGFETTNNPTILRIYSCNKADTPGWRI